MNVPLNAHVLVNKTIISDHTKGGARFTYSNNGIHVAILNTAILNNTNVFYGSTKASTLSV